VDVDVCDHELAERAAEIFEGHGGEVFVVAEVSSRGRLESNLLRMFWVRFFGRCSG
jgi:hypothetical protein